MHPQGAYGDKRAWPSLYRLGVMVAAVLAGLTACGALLAGLGGPVPGALAAPAGITRPFPGPFPCNTTLQNCITNSSAGDTIVVQPGHYNVSLTLSKAVNLTGVSSATVVLQALASQRVLAVTGAAVNSSVIISGLTFAGGHAVGGDCPDGCGGAILITATAQPLLINLTISSSIADFSGGGVYADASSPLVMSGVRVLSNASGSDGGGVKAASGSVTLNGDLFQNNQCTGVGCFGGGLVAAGSLTATDTQFLSNASLGSGGGANVTGNVLLTGVLFENNQCTGLCGGGGLATFGSLTATGTQFISNNGTEGNGGGAGAGGDVVLNGDTFEDNHCTVSPCGGGGVSAFHSLTVTNSSFLSNTSTSGGGAKAGRDVSLNGTLFQDNQCTESSCSGGGLFAVGKLAATNSNFLNNTSFGSGGGARVNGNVTLTGGTFQDNHCTGFCFGGGLETGANLTATNTQFVGNISVGAGGGASAGNVTISGSLFQNNHCTDPSFCLGGGLRAINLAATNTQFVANISIGGGGGAFSQFGIVTLNGDEFQANDCTGTNCRGGGLYAENDLGVTDTLFISNTAQQGAGLFLGGGGGRLVNDLFAANHAGLRGDALDLASPGAVTLLFNTIASPTVGSGAAIYVTTGTVALTDTLLASDTIGIDNAGGSVSEDFTLFSGVSTHLSGTVSGCGNCFSGPAGFVNPAGGDYHLALGSLAVDHGVDAGVNFDIDGDPRPLGHGFDIGFDELNIRHLFLPLLRR
jgi:hypothetical protein